MTFEVLLRPGRDDQISHLWGQEVPQPAYTFDFTHLVGDALFELLVQFHYLFCSLAQFFQKSRVLDSDKRLIREGFTRQDACGRITRSSASEEARYSPSRDHPTTARIHLNGAATHPLIETQVRSISSSWTSVPHRRTEWRHARQKNADLPGTGSVWPPSAGDRETRNNREFFKF